MANVTELMRFEDTAQIDKDLRKAITSITKIKMINFYKNGESMKERELESFLKVLNGEIDYMEGFSELIPNIEEFIKSNEKRTSSDGDLKYLICEEISKKFDKDDLSKFKIDKYFAYGIIKESFSSEKPLLQQDEAFDLIQSLESVELIDKLLKDKTLIIPHELRKDLMTKREKLLTHSVYDKSGNEIGTIVFSDDEIKALRAYVGDDVGYSFYPENDCTYMILNAYLKGGGTLGETSAGWKAKKAIFAILENPEEFMTFALNLSDALHIYGKTIKEPIQVSRSEPNAKYILEAQRTMSFFSGTRGKEELDIFRRAGKDSIHTIVQYGIDAIDIGDVLKGDYTKPEEKEILISPYIPFNHKTIEEHEYKTQDEVLSIDRIVGTYEIDFQTDTISKELSDEEKLDYEKNMEIFLDSNLRKKCIEMWKSDNTSKDDYFRWREAFSKVFSYRQRERALAIDRKIISLESHNLINSAIEATEENTRIGEINQQIRVINSMEIEKTQEEKPKDVRE